ncbi:MAG: AhpC/TSA family protein [Bacteroidales bacterium]|nr:AhpC/TSA family protein [Bacteroidales bacterium]
MKTINISIIALLFSTIIACGQESKGVNDARGLAVGAKAPLISAIDADSVKFDLTESLKQGPVVVIFYRGYWCPVCNKHLKQIQDSLSLISNKGATVVAVSPQKPEYLEKMEEKTGVKFRLLYDDGYKIANAYDVTFTPKKSELIIYNTALGANLKETHSDDSQRLPIPATYLIGQDGVIAWRQFDPDYKKRSSVNDIIRAIERLK